MTFRNGILSLAKTISNDYASSWHIGVWFVVPFCATGYMAQTWLGFSFYQAFLCALLMAVVVLVVKAASFLRAASGHAPIQANSARTFGSQGAFSTPTEERQVTLLDGHQMQSAGLLLFSTPATECPSLLRSPLAPGRHRDRAGHCHQSPSESQTAHRPSAASQYPDGVPARARGTIGSDNRRDECSRRGRV